MIDVFELLYFKYYEFQQRVGHSDIAPFTAALIIGFTLMVYCADLLFILMIFTKLDIGFIFDKLYMPLFFVINIVVVLIFIYKGRYNKILSRYKSISAKQGNLVAILFPTLAGLFLILSMYLKMLQNQGRF